VVAFNWLVAQLAQGADAVCGTITVRGWSFLPSFDQYSFERNEVNTDDQRHIHAGNLGMSTGTYCRAGAFKQRSTHEDVHRVFALEASGAHFTWSAASQVITSAWLGSRAPEGFGKHISLLVQTLDTAATCQKT
jgi:hypothetical protein